MHLALLSLAMMALFVNPVKAQDERFWRKLVDGQLASDNAFPDLPPKWDFAGPRYRYDLDGDGSLEGLQVAKRDGVDWLTITDHQQAILFNAKLWAMGGDSRIDRVRLLDLSANARVLVVYLFEGKTESKRLEASARLFFITFDHKNLKTLKLTMGPHYWHEFEGQREQYGRRLYSVNVEDFDRDGVKDISVEFNHMQSIWLYRGAGRWQSF